MHIGQYRVTGRIDFNFVNIAPLQLGEEAARVHLNFFLRSDVLSSSQQLLEAGIVADEVPHRIYF